MLRWCCLLMLVGLAACGPRESERLIVLHTGRMVGNVYPLETRALAPLQHYPYLAGYVKKVRAEAAVSGARVLLLDSGDSLGGSFASHATGGGNVAELFNALAYDAVFLGNLDANLAPEVFTRLKMPVLVPFARPDGTPPLPGASPARAVQVGDLPVVLLANFYGDTPASAHPHRFPMWFGAVDQPVQPVRNEAEWLAPLARAHPGSPILFHWMKFESPAEPPALVNELRRLGVTAIIAHRIYNSGTKDAWTQRDYTSWPVPVSENILRQNAGFTIARLDLVKRGGTWTAPRPHRIIQLTADTAPADPEIIARINQFAPVIRAADRPLAELSRGLGESEFLAAYTALLGQTTGADAVLYAPSSVRGPLPAGTLTANRLFAVIPWTSPLARLTLEQARLDQAAEGLHLWRRPGAPDSPALEVAGPLFTLRLVQAKLGLPPQALRVEPGSSEFDHAVRSIAARPETLGGTTPSSSSHASPR